MFSNHSLTEIDFIVFMVTLLGCLMLGQDLGIITGITLNLGFILLSSAKPDIDLYTEASSLIICPKGHLRYSSAEHLRDAITSHIFDDSINKVVIDGRSISSIDSSIAFVLCDVIKDLAKSNCSLALENWEYNSFGVLCRMDSEFKKMTQSEKAIV